MANAVPSRGGLWLVYCDDSGEFHRILETIKSVAEKIDLIDPEGLTFRVHLKNIESVQRTLTEKAITLNIESPD